MGIMRCSFGELSTRINHWTDFFTQNPREKVALYRGKTGEDDPSIANFAFRSSLTASQLYLGAPLGFRGHEAGYLIRQLDPKRFLVDLKRRPGIYVTQSFDDKMHEFRRSDPICMTEGLLDAECFQQITGYPYVVAYLTSSVSSDLALFLALITSRVILVPDYDPRGKENLPLSEKALKYAGVRYGILKEKACKDMGDCWAQRDLHEGVRARLRSQL